MQHRPLHIFISHSSHDLPFVEKLAHDLRTMLRNPQAVWYDTSDLVPGERWWSTILTELDHCTAFLVICSPDAMTSNWVKDEINIAWQRRNTNPRFHLIPLLYQPCTLHSKLNTLQHITFLENALYDESLQNLLKALDTNPPGKKTISRRTVLIGAAACLLVAGGSTLAYALRQSSLSPDAHGSSTLASEPTLQIQNAFAEPVSMLVWSPVTNTLAIGTARGYVGLWEIKGTAQDLSQPNAETSLDLASTAGIAWSTDGTMLALGPDAQGQTQVYKSDLTALVPELTRNFPTVNYPTIQSFCWVPGAYIFSLVVESSTDPVEGSLYTSDPRNPEQQLSTTVLDSISLDPSITPPLATSPNTSMLAIGLRASVIIGRVHVAGTQVTWNAYPALSIQKSWAAEPLACKTLAWSPDSRYIAALTTDGALYGLSIWDSKQQFQPLTPALDLSELQGDPVALAWSPNPTKPWLAIGGAGGRIGLWHVGAGIKPVQIFPGIPSQIAALAWSHDGMWLAASYEDASMSILLWRIGV